MTFSEAHVFPGGKWEPADSLLTWGQKLGIGPEIVASTPLTQEMELNSLKITAIRETFEESGIFIGSGSLGKPESGDFYRLCMKKGSIPDLPRLRYFARIIGPLGFPPRFDTVYFLTFVPSHTQFTITEESQSAQWLRPVELLERAAELNLLQPQGFSALLLAHYPLFQELMQAGPLPVLRFSLVGVVMRPAILHEYMVVMYGDEEYPTPPFLPKITGKRFRLWLDTSGLQYEISPGLIPFLDSSPYTLIRELSGKIRVQRKSLL